MVVSNVRMAAIGTLLVTNENPFPLSSTRFVQPIHQHDWRPVGWVWDADAFMFAPPTVKWNPAKA